MMESHWAVADDVALWTVVVTLVLGLASIALLGFELAGRETKRRRVFASGVAATLAVALCVLRPARVDSTHSRVGPRIVVLVDQSRRLLLPADGERRIDRARSALAAAERHFADARLSVFGFSDGKLRRLVQGDPELTAGSESDLVAALQNLARDPTEHPQAVVVLSDGRLRRPGEEGSGWALDDAGLRVPIHTVRLAQRAPADASIRSVAAAGAAVAHQPLALTVEVGCAGGLDCERIPVKVEALRDSSSPALLARGVANASRGLAKVELEVELEQAGERVVRVALEAPDGDEVPGNDERLTTFVVARERVRLLHLAGRPTYDVRALRSWLKSDESVDVVAFFILRDSQGDDPGARNDELALIQFPVDELFTEHLHTFDAVILQDIDAIRYKLDRYLRRLADYVKGGGGLIMVGGPSSFAGGNYAGTALDSILPVEQAERERAFDSKPFAPRYTRAGRSAAVTQPLRDLLGDALPVMTGTNYLGPSRPRSIVLWEHPELKVGETPMPVLALGEVGDGRSIALAVDSTHRLSFGRMAASVAGRAYGALWDGLLGWLMRDPRYEAARVELVGECIEGEPTRLRVTRLPGMEGRIVMQISKLGAGGEPPIERELAGNPGEPAELVLGELVAGGYSVRTTIGAAPPSRHDFACERGGAAWADSRPDPQRLERIASATTGASVGHDEVSALPLVAATQVSAHRSSSPLAPPWVWSLASAVLLGTHWIFRRRAGLV